MAGSGFLRFALAQINPTVGDLAGNRALIAESYRRATHAGARVVVFPELALTGYPPEDLLLRPAFLEDTRASLRALGEEIRHALAIVGFVDATPAGPANAAALIAGGELLDVYHKCTLPNYGVFDEQRYFVPGRRCPVYDVDPWRLAVNICEDIWIPEGVPAQQAGPGGANLMINISASPYHAGKGTVRRALVTGLAARLGLTLLHVNLVGGQDELVFDGQSLVADPAGRLLARAPQFAPHLLLVDLPRPGKESGGTRTDAPGTVLPAVETLTPGAEIPPAGGALSAERRPLPGAARALAVLSGERGAGVECLPTPESSEPAAAPWISLGSCADELGSEEEVYRALIVGLRDYVRKNDFRGVVLGLSGGIDSALTAAIAVDALGGERVVGISMPSEYTSASAQEGARELAARLGIAFHELPIRKLFDRALEDLQPLFGDLPPDITEENVQARIRGMLLMAYSNKFGHLVLATGNKSELAVGYCTLYGDMVGGYAVLKDVFKTHVYRLARWRNARGENAPIPEDTLTRPPSAELRPDQQDTDSLPPYEELDPIVEALVQDDRSPSEVVARGFERDLVYRIYQMIQDNEYKRRQAAPGIKITPRAFGKDRRYPMTNRYRPPGA